MDRLPTERTAKAVHKQPEDAAVHDSLLWQRVAHPPAISCEAGGSAEAP